MIFKPWMFENRSSHLIRSLKAHFGLIEANADQFLIDHKGAFRQMFFHWTIVSDQINTVDVDTKLCIIIYIVT